ncbi:MAG: L-threonylcarbamoyladenylate synthase [Brumimicrobium sp.]
MNVDLAKAVVGLKNGKTLLYPTDTIWGLGCDATNEDAINQISEIKNRPKEKSFIVLVNNVAMLERYVSEFPEVCYDLIDLAEKPLTIIYDKPIGFPKSLLAEDGSIGIRVTQDPICSRLIQGLRKPLLSTSANISGEDNPISFSDISDEIKTKVDLILQERLNERMGKPSSIIKISSDNSVKVIR